MHPNDKRGSQGFWYLSHRRAAKAQEKQSHRFTHISLASFYVTY